MGLDDINQILTMEDMANEVKLYLLLQVFLMGTLKGVVYYETIGQNQFRCNESKAITNRFIEAIHRLDKKT